jgi:hypothetical protein
VCLILARQSPKFRAASVEDILVAIHKSVIYANLRYKLEKSKNALFHDPTILCDVAGAIATSKSEGFREQEVFGVHPRMKSRISTRERLRS